MKYYRFYLFFIFLFLIMGCSDNNDLEYSEEELEATALTTTVCSDCDAYSMYNTSLTILKDQAKSVGQIYESTNFNSSTRLCSGTLLNNTSTTYKPLYFVTAAHCLYPKVEDNVSPTILAKFEDDQLTDTELSTVISQVNSDINQWVVRFDYECSSNSQINPGFSIGSLELKAINIQTDMALFIINGSVSQTNKEKLILSGWSRSTASSSSNSYDVHHPGSNPKKFAISNSGYTTFNNTHTIDDFPNYLPRSNFWYTQWNTGGFTNGSSGSGLINNQGKLVGFLTGGDQDNFDGCINNEVAFGKFDKAWYWSANSQNYYDSKRTLKNWLSPAPNNVTELGSHSFAPPPTPVAATGLTVTQLNTPCNPQQLWCGEIELSWTAGSGVTYKVFRRINTGTNQLIKTITNTSTTTYIDPYVRSWAANNNLSYTLSSFDSNGNFISNMTVTTTGGLIAF